MGIGKYSTNCKPSICYMVGMQLEHFENADFFLNFDFFFSFIDMLRLKLRCVLVMQFQCLDHETSFGGLVPIVKSRISPFMERSCYNFGRESCSLGLGTRFGSFQVQHRVLRVETGPLRDVMTFFLVEPAHPLYR